jgi:hypothetical protein
VPGRSARRGRSSPCAGRSWSPFYSPARGSFLNHDDTPAGNPYAYAGDDPVTDTDLTGHSPDGDSSGPSQVTQAEVDQAKAAAAAAEEKASGLEKQAAQARATEARDLSTLNAAASYARQMNTQAGQASQANTEAQEQAEQALLNLDAYVIPYGGLQALESAVTDAEVNLQAAQNKLLAAEGGHPGVQLDNCVTPDGSTGCVGGNPGNSNQAPAWLIYLDQELVGAAQIQLDQAQAQLSHAQSLQSKYQSLKSKADSLWNKWQQMLRCTCSGLPRTKGLQSTPSELHDRCVLRVKKACQTKSRLWRSWVAEMTARRPPEELLQQEVRELTDLLRHADSFADLRDVLAARGTPASETILAGLIESEDESRYGVILTAGQKCVRFETAPNGSLARWETIDEPDALTSDFQAVSVGISMMRRGQIS